MRADDMQMLTTAAHRITNYGVGLVLRSEDPAIKPGDHIYSNGFPFQEYFVGKGASSFRVLENKEGLPWSVYVGVLGMPGQTAHHAWKEYALPQKVRGHDPYGTSWVWLTRGAG